MALTKENTVKQVREEILNMENAVHNKSITAATIAMTGARSFIIDFLENLSEDNYVEWQDPNAIDTPATAPFIKVLNALESAQRASRQGEREVALEKIAYIKELLSSAGGRRHRGKKTRKGKKRITRASRRR